MSDDKAAAKRTATTTEPTGDAAVADDVAEVQATVDQEEEQGFRGTDTDPTPNSAYTVAGVTSGAHTPEGERRSAIEAGG